MKVISSAVIDQIIEHLESLDEDQYEGQVDAFADAQPVLIAWLFSEQFDLLSDEEKGYLQYLSLITWMAIEKVNGPLGAVSEDEIGEAEEENYEILELNAGKKFNDRLDPFFEKTSQEELMAFAEEAVMEDESDPESFVSKEGRELIFLALATMIDVLTNED